jgi:hypothetical protein
LSILWTRKDSVDDGERKLSFRDIFAEALVVRILRVLKVLIIVSDLEQNSNQVHERDIVTTVSAIVEEGYENLVLGLHACMSLIASRRSPPVLLLTISTYSSSVGQVRLSRQKRSMPCPR